MRYTILLVDDDERARRGLKGALQAAGFRVVDARGGSHAVRICEYLVGQVDMLIAEVAISAPNGVALADVVTAWWPHATVLLMSDSVVAAVTESRGSRRVMRVRSRPVAFEELVQAARCALDAG